LLWQKTCERVRKTSCGISFEFVHATKNEGTNFSQSHITFSNKKVLLPLAMHATVGRPGLKLHTVVEPGVKHSVGIKVVKLLFVSQFNALSCLQI